MKKKLLIISLLTTAAALVLYSCSREEFGGGSNRKGRLTVGDAKSYFEKSFSGTRSGIDVYKPVLTPGDFTPLWDEAKTVYDGLSCVNTPIFPSFSYEAVWHLDGNEYRVKVFQKYLTVRDIHSGQTSDFLLTLIPCANFPRGDGDLGDRFQNCGNKANFTGIALYNVFSASFPVQIDTYIDGAVVSSIAIRSGASGEEVAEKIAQMSTFMDGITFDRYRVPPANTRGFFEFLKGLWEAVKDFVEEVVDAVTGEGNDGNNNNGNEGNNNNNGNKGNSGGSSSGEPIAFSYVHPTIYIKAEPLIYSSWYDVVGSPVASSGGGGGGGSGSGSNNNNNNDNDNDHPPIIKKVEYMKLDPSIVAQDLEKKLEEIRKNCLGEGLHNLLKAGRDINVTYSDGVSYYIAGDDKVGLADNAGPADLFHEIGHHGQAEPYKEHQGDNDHFNENYENIQEYNGSLLNFECEMYLLTYQYIKQSGTSFITGIPYAKWIDSEEAAVCREVSKLLDSRGNLKPGVTEEEFNKSFENIGRVLQKNHPEDYGNLQYNTNWSAADNLRMTRKISSGC